MASVDSEEEILLALREAEPWHTVVEICRKQVTAGSRSISLKSDLDATMLALRQYSSRNVTFNPLVQASPCWPPLQDYRLNRLRHRVTCRR